MVADESLKSQYANLARKYEDTAKTVASHYCPYGGYVYRSLLCSLITFLWEVGSKLPPDLTDTEEQAWVYSVLNNKAHNLIRDEQVHHNRMEYRETLPEMADEEDDVYLKRLYDLIEMLDDGDRDVLYMYLDGKTMAEIGKVLGGSEQRALRRMKKIRAKLCELNEKTE